VEGGLLVRIALSSSRRMEATPIIAIFPNISNKFDRIYENGWERVETIPMLELSQMFLEEIGKIQ
tara:strand:+ start:871 stop:1065 length:195 start_codon:yes stop_codon:yes gene_type:complete